MLTPLKDIPLEIGLLPSLDLSQYSKEETGRRFSKLDGEYVEIPIFSRGYEFAEFAELILDFQGGKHRFNRIVIIYGRVVQDEAACALI